MGGKINKCQNSYHTEIGKHSYGPLCCDNPYIEKIGAFCSFAHGAVVVANHEMNYVTTHPIISGDACIESIKTTSYSEECPWWLQGIEPKKERLKMNKRVIIGNDVWLGHNTIIANGAIIGDGVVAGAGSIITKNVPDYAIVVGVPARIVRYRYKPDEIKALKRIAWWNWTDDDIRERYDDLYLPISSFIEKYDSKF